MIKFGIVGCGNIGKRHAQRIMENDRAELVMIYDVDRARSTELSKTYDVLVANSFEELCNSNVDVVCVCTPSGNHADSSIKIFESGKHVLCEKPMTISLKDADRVIEAEKKSGNKFFLVKQNRYNPPVQVLKDLMIKGNLGEVMLMNCDVIWNRGKQYYENSWRGTMKDDGGSLMTQCSHFLDLMIWVGGKVKGVYAKMDNLSHPYIETEDVGLVTINFENGSIGSLRYTVSAYQKNVEGNMTVIGTKGNVKIGGEYLNVLEYWNVEGMDKPTLEAGNPANDYGTYKGSMSNHDKVIENVVQVLIEEKSINASSLQGRESIEVMQAAYISAIKKCEVELPLSNEDYSFNISDQVSFSGNKKNV